MRAETRDWQAVLYTLLWPGLGHLHQGRAGRGVHRRRLRGRALLDVP